MIKISLPVKKKKNGPTNSDHLPQKFQVPEDIKSTHSKKLLDLDAREYRNPERLSIKPASGAVFPLQLFANSRRGN